MIKISNLTKKFDNKTVIDNLTLEIKKGSIYGLVGTNGGGKTTLINIVTGILKADSGEILIDEISVYENPAVKSKLFYVSDDSFFYQNYSLDDMAKFYKDVYSNSWSDELYEKLIDSFPINRKSRIKTFSKGMKRQCAIILALATQPEYLFLDEAFDGLDAVIRMAVRKFIADIVAQRNMTVIIASHNLRELEDLCDTVGLIYNGHFITEISLLDMANQYLKVQLAFKDEFDMPELDCIDGIISIMEQNNFITIISTLSEETLKNMISELSPVYSQFVPLSLEEIFISEMEVAGYDYSIII